jgi:hypothetical protein
LQDCRIAGLQKVKASRWDCRKVEGRKGRKGRKAGRQEGRKAGRQEGRKDRKDRKVVAA